MYNTDVIALECNHRFHKKCINDWFREKHDCPQCRNYSLPKDDFPSLLSGGRWIRFHTICLISRNNNISIRLYHIYDISEYFEFSRNVWWSLHVIIWASRFTLWMILRYNLVMMLRCDIKVAFCKYTSTTISISIVFWRHIDWIIERGMAWKR